MPHIEGRIVHDADSHVMESPDWLACHAPHADRRASSFYSSRFSARGFGRWQAQQADPAYRAQDASEIMARKNHAATGAFLRDDRPLAVDLIGTATQLVFPTTLNVMLERLQHSNDVDLLYALADATNQAQVHFCAIDGRLLPVGYVPLAALDRAPVAAARAIDQGCRALLIPWACPRRHATSHIALDAVWARAQAARIPILLHVGDANLVLPSQHANNGLPPVQDFHGGDENFRSISYMAIPSGPQQALAMLILDGVLERFPQLMVGVIELGAVWVPGLMRQLDAAMEAFGRHEDRLRELSLAPSEYVRRQVRVTPYPTEPAGWIIEQSDPRICMFSTDYPHVEGGRNPYGRFLRSTDTLDESTRDRFFCGNFAELMHLPG